MSLTLDLVSSQMNVVKAYASDSFELASEYIAELNSYIIAEIDMNPPVINVDVDPSITIDPTLAAQIPTAPDSGDYPSAPNSPSVSDYTFPDRISYTLPAVPVLKDITIPTFIENSISGITAVLPEFTDAVPTVNEISAGGDVPQDSLVQTIKSKLEDNILNGGTMLDPDVEDDIWNRDHERQEQALQDAIDKVTAQWAKLGFSMPNGLLSGHILALNNEYLNKRLDRSREIAVKQAELEQQGMFESMKLGVSLEQVLIGSQNEYAKRVLEASKATADVTITIFKERISRFNALLDKYKTDVTAYKTRIEAEIARAEVYKTQVQGLAIVAGIDETKVKIYTAQIGAIEQMVSVYQNEVKAVALCYEAEKAKVERYKVQVEAYTAEVDTITKKYATQVEAFKTYVTAWAASVDSKTKLIDVDTRAQIAEVDAQIKEWEVEMKLVEQHNALKLEALRTAAQTASNLAAGAMAALHTSASAAFSSSSSESTSTSL